MALKYLASLDEGFEMRADVSDPAMYCAAWQLVLIDNCKYKSKI